MPKRLSADVAFLSGLVPPRSAANTESLNKAADYIDQEFKKVGCCPGEKNGVCPAEKKGRLKEQKFRVDGKEYRNIICSFGSDEGERVIVGAHYDSDEKGTPGADDNASGVAGILELARMIRKDKTALERLEKINRRLDLIAYTLEEPPYFDDANAGVSNMGSYHHAESLFTSKIPVKLMISLEMIGYFSEEYPDNAMLNSLCRRKGTYIAVVGKREQDDVVSRVSALMAQKSTIDVVSFSEPAIVPAIWLSDQRNYWYFGYPAVMITDTADLRNTNYHETSDTVDTLDFNKMAGVVEAVYAAMIGY